MDVIDKYLTWSQVVWDFNFLSNLSSYSLCPPPGSSSLLPAVRFGPSRLRWQAHRHGDDEIHPGDIALPVLCVPPWGPDPGLPPTDQQPLPAACGASAGGRTSQHEILTQTERKLENTLRLTPLLETIHLYKILSLLLPYFYIISWLYKAKFYILVCIKNVFLLELLCTVWNVDLDMLILN